MPVPISFIMRGSTVCAAFLHSLPHGLKPDMRNRPVFTSDRYCGLNPPVGGSLTEKHDIYTLEKIQI